MHVSDDDDDVMINTRDVWRMKWERIKFLYTEHNTENIWVSEWEKVDENVTKEKHVLDSMESFPTTTTKRCIFHNFSFSLAHTIFHVIILSRFCVVTGYEKLSHGKFYVLSWV